MGNLDSFAKRRREQKQAEADESESDQEKKVRQKIISEAKENGATLDKPDAKGGLSPSLVLGVFRRDKWQCKRCQSQDKIGPHHKGGIVESGWLSRRGHENSKSNITTLCASCHDAVHNEAREDGVDSSQVLPAGDKGNPKRDKGDKPVANG